MSELLSRTVKYGAAYFALMARHAFDPQGRDRPRMGPTQTRAVCLIHGFMGTRAVTRPYQRWFERDGVPAFGFDLGFDSMMPLPYILRKFAHRIGRLRAELPQLTRLDLVGHSMGGIIAAEAIESGLLDGLNPRLVGLGTPFRGTPVALMGWFIPGAFALLPFHERYWNFDRLTRLRSVPILSLAGGGDVLAPPGCCDHPLAVNEVLAGFDHASLLLRKCAYVRVAEFLATH